MHIVNDKWNDKDYMISESTNSEAEPENSVEIGSSDTQPQNAASDSDDTDRSVALLNSLRLSDACMHQ